MNKEELEYKKYVEEQEELRKGRIERKLNKIYEKLLDLEERLDRKDNKERKQQIKKEQERLRDEELSLEADTFYSNKRIDRMNYFEDKY